MILLVIINILLLGFIWSHRPDVHLGNKPHQSEISGHFLIKKLHLDPVQQEAFKEELKIYRKKTDSLSRIAGTKKNMVTRAIIHGDSSLASRYSLELFEAQKNLELEFQRLTSRLSGLCNDQQKKEYLRLMENVFRKDPGHHYPDNPGNDY